VVSDGHRSPGQTGRCAATDRDEHAATPAQVAVAWLLQRSPVLLPIPGTSDVAHLEQNVRAGLIELTPDQMQQLGAAI
jgi:aryl-alcohol dehydrogenase-like predicted oxidoreductase